MILRQHHYFHWGDVKIYFKVVSAIWQQVHAKTFLHTNILLIYTEINLRDYDPTHPPPQKKKKKKKIITGIKGCSVQKNGGAVWP